MRSTPNPRLTENFIQLFRPDSGSSEQLDIRSRFWYEDRFMIGSDKVGHWNGYESEIRKYDPLIALLDEDTRLMVTQTNILDLIHVDPVTMQRVEALAPAA